MNPIQTIRSFIDSVHIGEWTGPIHRKEALAALAELEKQKPVAWLVEGRDDTRLISHGVHLDREDAKSMASAFAQHYPIVHTKALYSAAPVAQQPQLVGEVLPQWNTEKERVDGVRAHLHKELPVDTKLYAYLPTVSKPLFPSGTPEAIEKARNVGLDLS